MIHVSSIDQGAYLLCIMSLTYSSFSQKPKLKYKDVVNNEPFRKNNCTFRG